MRLKCSCAACSGLGIYIHHTILHVSTFPCRNTQCTSIIRFWTTLSKHVWGDQNRICTPYTVFDSIPAKILYIYCGAHRRRCARAWYTLLMYMVYGFGKPDKHVNNCAGEEQGPTEGGVQGLGILCLCIWCMVLANPTNM